MQGKELLATRPSDEYKVLTPSRFVNKPLVLWSKGFLKFFGRELGNT